MVFVDRKAKYPGRWTMRKSDGTSEVVTLVRNDEPEVEGTPMNAETLNTLSDVAGADVARIQAEAAQKAAATSATAALGSASAAEKSKTGAATSEANAAKHEEAAKKAAKKAEAVVGTDKTFAIEGAPADAKAVGDYILDRTKETPQPIFYSKAEVDKLLADCKEAAKREALLAANPVGKLWASDDPTSPASIVGGTWEQIKDRFILAAGDTYAAGSTGGEADHTLTINEMPEHRHIENMQASNNGIAAIALRESKGDYSGMSGYAQHDWLENSLGLSTDSAGRDVAHNNMPPYIAMYVWKRIA